MSALRRVVALAVVVALAAVACGVPRDQGPDRIAVADLPAGLNEDAPPTQVPIAGDATQIQVWFVGPDERLRPQGRLISSTPEAIMNSLLLGPETIERGNGVFTAITNDTAYNSVVVNEEAMVAFVDLTEGSLRAISGRDKELAFAQIVFSLTGLPAITTVVFSIDEQGVSIPTDLGASSVGQAIQRGDFASLDPTNINFGAEDDEVVDDAPPTPPPGPIPTPNFDDTNLETTDLSIWMVTESRTLAPVVRTIERKPEAVVDALLLGPDVFEVSQGLTSAISLEAVAFSTDVVEDAGTALVDLADGSLPPVDGSQQRLLAVGQIVYSLTELFEIDAVILSVAGRQVDIPTERGIAEGGTPLTRGEFLSLAPNVAPVPTPEAAEPDQPAEPTATAIPAPTPVPTATPGA